MESEPTIPHLSGMYRLHRRALARFKNDLEPHWFWVVRADGPPVGCFPETKFPDLTAIAAAAKEWLQHHVFELTIDSIVYRLHHIPIADVLYGHPDVDPDKAQWYITGRGHLVAQFAAAPVPDLEIAEERLRQALG
jgi:hypothetical protein